MFRMGQFRQFVRDMPLPYLVILLVLLAVLVVGVYRLMESLVGALAVSGLLLLLLLLVHNRRKDYHFIHLAYPFPERIFWMDYLLVAFPVVLMGFLQGFWYVGLGVMLLCGGIAFAGQPLRREGRRAPVLLFILPEMFEFLSGFRRQWIALAVLYALAFVGLLLPYASLVVLWLFTAFFFDSFKICEPRAMLCSGELPPGTFICRKVWVNARLYMLAVLPVCLLHSLLYPDTWWLAVVFFVLGTLNIVLNILYKYAVYEPGKRIVSGQISLGFSYIGILFPPFALLSFILLPRYAVLAHRNLKTYLYAYY